LLDHLAHVVGFEIRRPPLQLRTRQAAHAALAELFDREHLRIVPAVDEWVRVLAPALGLGQRRARTQRTQDAPAPVRRLRGAGGQGGGRGGRTRRIGDDCLSRAASDEDAAARTRLKKAVVGELTIRGGHGVAAQTGQLRKITRRRQRGTLRETSGQDLAHQRGA
jgi:hypothetical protein